MGCERGHWVRCNKFRCDGVFSLSIHKRNEDMCANNDLRQRDFCAHTYIYRVFVAGNIMKFDPPFARFRDNNEHTHECRLLQWRRWQRDINVIFPNTSNIFATYRVAHNILLQSRRRRWSLAMHSRSLNEQNVRTMTTARCWGMRSKMKQVLHSDFVLRTSKGIFSKRLLSLMLLHVQKCLVLILCFRSCSRLSCKMMVIVMIGWHFVVLNWSFWDFKRKSEKCFLTALFLADLVLRSNKQLTCSL